jgi:hypothetical protein
LNKLWIVLLLINCPAVAEVFEIPITEAAPPVPVAFAEVLMLRMMFPVTVSLPAVIAIPRMIFAEDTAVGT